MQNIRDFFAGFSMLKDWQDEVNRAYEVSKINYHKNWSPPVETPVHRDALVLDLASYRAKRASA